MGDGLCSPHAPLKCKGRSIAPAHTYPGPAVVHGKPVVRGTRIPVEGILRKLSEGATEADILAAYPRLTRDDIHAVLRSAGHGSHIPAGVGPIPSYR